MIRYQVKKGGVLTNEWTSDFAGADYYEPNFGDREWVETVPVLDEQGQPVVGEDGLPVTTGVTHPQTYEVIATDISYEYEMAQWRAKRAAAYPPLADLADGMVHAAAGDPTQLNAYYAACEAVKAAIPKPEAPA